MIIVSMNCHEALNSMWATIAKELHLIHYEDVYYWRGEHRPLPSNVILYPKGVYPHLRNVACTVAFNDDSQPDKLSYIAAPMINALAVTYFNPENPKDLSARPSEHTISKLKRRNTVFCGEVQKMRWGLEGVKKAPVHYYGVDMDLWKPGPHDDGTIIVVAHDFKYRDNVLDYHWCSTLLDGLPWRIIGRQRDDLQCEYPRAFFELQNIYSKASVFFDPAHCSPLSFALIEAMAAGMAIVTRPHDDIPYFLENNVNAIVSNDDKELKDACQMLLANPAERKRLGDNARATAEQYFLLKRWQEDTRTYLKLVGVRV